MLNRYQNQIRISNPPKMLGLNYLIVLSVLISLPDAANSYDPDEMADAARAARKQLLNNFSKEELATLSDDQIHHIIEMLPQARKIVRILCTADNQIIFHNAVLSSSHKRPSRLCEGSCSTRG